MDGLEEEQPKGVPVYFDPETGRSYIIEEDKEEEDKGLTEEEKQYDLNNNGILDDQEKAKLEYNRLLNNPGISSWRRKKLRDYLDGNTKTYF